jgi:3-deoxy-D-manno-octulosonic-acid transferase
METRFMNPKTTNPFEDWPYRWGMRLYRAGISAFLAGGGFSFTWLRRKYETVSEERMGKFKPGVPRNAFWVHSVSIGEVQSAFPLVEAMKKDSNLPCVLSTATTTGRTMAERLLSQKADAMIYNPWDAPRFVRRALDALAPRAYIAMETERWPVILAELRARKIPAFLVNGRLSAASAEKLRSQRRFWRGVLCCFDRLTVRFESDKEEFSSLGIPAEKIIVTGDCKIDAIVRRKNEVDPAKWRFLRKNGNALFLAGSTHKNEEEFVLEAFSKARTARPGARLVIVPRYPERAPEVVRMGQSYGKTVLLSNLEADWEIAVVDKIGILFELYAAVDAAFVGGSLTPRGGQSPMEPAAFGLQTAHGPNMRNFPDAARMDELGAACCVETPDQLAESWARSLNPDEQARNREACAKYFEPLGGGAARSWEVIKEYLNI